MVIEKEKPFLNQWFTVQCFKQGFQFLWALYNFACQEVKRLETVWDDFSTVVFETRSASIY